MTRQALDTLDATAVRRWAFRARDALAQHRHRIDALNVYPVPDGDTGTNLYLTFHAGLEGLVGSYVASEAGPLSLRQGAATLARSTLFSARGNSGVILSQLVRGLSAVLEEKAGEDEDGQDDEHNDHEIDGPTLARVLQKASEYAWTAVTAPVEGTILSVMRAAAEASTQMSRITPGLEAVIRAGVEAARAALAATPHQLEDLRRAGVVDAGGAGLLLILEALLQVVTGADGPPELGVFASIPSEAGREGQPVTRPDAFTGQVAVPDFEVMYLIDGCRQEQAAALRERLGGLGDSVIVAGDDDVRSVHVHTSDAGSAIEAGLGAGRIYGIRVNWLHDHGNEAGEIAACGADVDGSLDEPRRAVGVIATTQGDGLAELFARAGALVVRDAPGRRVTPKMLIDAMRTCGTETVIVLPCDSDVLLAAQVAADLGRELGLRPVVVPSRHTLQGLAALAVFEPDVAGVAERMSEAAAAVRCGMVVTASSDSITDAGPCRRGDVLGFDGNRVVLVHSDAVQAAVSIVRRLAGQRAEMVTLVSGQAAPDLAEQVAGRLAEELPDLEVTTLLGGQPVYDLLVGVE